MGNICKFNSNLVKTDFPANLLKKNTGIKAKLKRNSITNEEIPDILE
jgi:hypothetical protein